MMNALVEVGKSTKNAALERQTILNIAVYLAFDLGYGFE